MGAVNVFNFAQANWGQFSAAANSVSDSQWKPLWSFCNTNGDATISADELTACASIAANYVGMSDNTQQFLYDSASNTGILLMLTRAAHSTTTSTSTPWPPLPPSTPASSWAPLTVTTTVSSPDPS